MAYHAPQNILSASSLKKMSKAQSTEQTSLPPPTPDQAFMVVSALEAGHIDLPAHRFAKDVPKDEIHKCPSLAFYLKHSKTNEHLVFDMGIRKNTETFNAPVKEGIKFLPVRTPQDVSESLMKGGIKPDEVRTVILSHVHFDHVGDHRLFPKANFLVGEAAKGALADAYPNNPASTSFVLPDSVPEDRVKYLSNSLFTHSIGGFPAAIDYFGDGSIYVIDSPGHLGGHINVLARTSPTGSWIYLGGDTCHDLRILRGEKEIFYEVDSAGRIFNCIHENKELAAAHISRVRAVGKVKGVHVLLAHDYEWYAKNKGGPVFFPGRIPPADL